MRLDQWLKTVAGINERILDSTMRALSDAEIFDVRDLYHLEPLPLFDTCFREVTASKVRAALKRDHPPVATPTSSTTTTNKNLPTSSPSSVSPSGMSPYRSSKAKLASIVRFASPVRTPPRDAAISSRPSTPTSSPWQQVRPGTKFAFETGPERRPPATFKSMEAVDAALIATVIAYREAKAANPGWWTQKTSPRRR